MTSRRQGPLSRLRLPPALLRRGINLWPPFAATGIRVTRVADDYREIDVTLKLGLTNRNYFGTHFGGSLYAMTDPFFAIMMLQNLGPGYVVWDKAGAIRYLRPGRGDVFAHFRLPAAAIARARKATGHGRKHEPTFRIAIVDADGMPVAEVEKTLYVRRHAEPSAEVEASAPAARRAARTRGTARPAKTAGRPRTARPGANA